MPKHSMCPQASHEGATGKWGKGGHPRLGEMDMTQLFLLGALVALAPRFEDVLVQSPLCESSCRQSLVSLSVCARTCACARADRTQNLPRRDVSGKGAGPGTSDTYLEILMPKPQLPTTNPSPLTTPNTNLEILIVAVGDEPRPLPRVLFRRALRCLAPLCHPVFLRFFLKLCLLWRPVGTPAACQGFIHPDGMSGFYQSQLAQHTLPTALPSKDRSRWAAASRARTREQEARRQTDPS
jgi:hypothetical protein